MCVWCNTRKVGIVDRFRDRTRWRNVIGRIPTGDAGGRGGGVTILEVSSWDGGSRVDWI